tara:strand:- start:1232 stop:1441 length:210 start_codon:yes stop_codon:yes gene_type:complete
MERRKFKILYPEDHHDLEKRGKPYKPNKDEVVVMNGSGVFFLYNGMEYYPFIRKLSQDLPKYDVVWKEK